MPQTTKLMTRGATRILAWNDMDAGWTPRLESWRCSQKAMGFEISMLLREKEDTSSLSTPLSCSDEGGRVVGCFG